MQSLWANVAPSKGQPWLDGSALPSPVVSHELGTAQSLCDLSENVVVDLKGPEHLPLPPSYSLTKKYMLASQKYGVFTPTYTRVHPVLLHFC